MRAMATAVLMLSCGAVVGQGPSQDQLRERLEKKRASAFLDEADWTLHYDAARAAAREGGLLIFAYFTRSYAP